MKIKHELKLGLTLKEIAAASGMTENVVKKHNALNKLPNWFKRAVVKQEVRCRTSFTSEKKDSGEEDEEDRINWTYNHFYELAKIVEYPFFKEIADKVLSGELKTVKETG